MAVVKYILQITTLIIGIIYLLKYYFQVQHLRLEFEKIKDQLNPSERQRKENVITTQFLIAFVIIFGIFAVIAVIELAFKAVFEV